MNLGYLMLEAKRGLRHPRYLTFTIVLPCTLYLIYINIFPGQVPGTTMPYATYHVTMLAALGSVMAATASTAQTAVEKSIGWQRQLRLTPLSTPSYLMTKTSVSMIVSLTPILVLAAFGRVVSGVQMSATAWTQVVFGTWLATLPFALLGLLIGQLATPQTMPAYLNGTQMLMSLLGGLFFPTVSFPGWMLALAKSLPSYWIGEISRGALTGSTPFLPAIAVLGSWIVGISFLITLLHRRAVGRG